MLLENKKGDQDSFAEAPTVNLCRLAVRFIEVTSGAACLTLLAPMLLLTAVAIKLDSRGPLFIHERRYGYRNRRIAIRKFRTATGHSLDGPPRLTRVGQFLRQTGIEDLPMLINVMRGEMSIIGPPARSYPTASLNECKPGVTRWSDLFSLQNRGGD
jgi:lipopolysaccharide/colanic/teichoic acid biosynthesis glycosyltransferase